MYDAAKCNTPCRDNDDNKYYGIQHGLRKVLEPHVDISATNLWSQDDAKAQATKIQFVVGIFPYDGTYEPPWKYTCIYLGLSL